jgi:hypothetical protein
VPAADVDRPEAWDEFVKGVAAAISPLDLDFRHQQDELTGTQLYAIVRAPLYIPHSPLPPARAR